AAQTCQRALTEPEARAVLQAFGISFVAADVAQDGDQAVQIAERLGYPVVLKVVSPEIIHKSDAGGVKVNLDNAQKVQAAYSEILANAQRYKPEAEIHGLLVSRQAAPGVEIIVGGIRDPQFGPAVMVGFGGIFVEVLKDVAFRVAPISEKEARAMLRDLRLYPLLTGAWGREKADLDALAQMLVQVGQALVAVPAIKEIDLNPVRVYSSGAIALDARVIV
ncbi:MAG: acetyl-CoA synthetase, partial [Firmicutes bacterium]|nr:acetyl-CoA synthetase [Bacillota bacterium]